MHLNTLIKQNNKVQLLTNFMDNEPLPTPDFFHLVRIFYCTNCSFPGI